MFYEIAGWIGALLLLTGFIWALRKPNVSRKNGYLALNIFGSLGIIINTYNAGAYPAVFFNVVWASAALVMLIKQTKNNNLVEGK